MNDLDVYKQQGFGNRAGFGKRPALLIVDFVNGFADPSQFGGGNIGPAISRTQELLAACRRLGVPVAHTRVVYADDGSDAGVFAMKAPSLLKLTETAHASQIVEELTPVPGEYIVRKTQASPFHGTGLEGWLQMKGIDTVLVTGCTTSGCVRAAVVDSTSRNFRTIVVRDCVGDRAQGPHEANLFDMEQKYADLHTADEVIAQLSGLRAAAE